MSFVAAAVAGAVGLGTAAIGASASNKAAKAQKQSADAQVDLSREQFNRQDELAQDAYKRQTKTVRNAYKNTRKAAGSERNALTKYAQKEYEKNFALAKGTFNRNYDLVRDARDDVLGGIKADRARTESALRTGRDKQLGLYGKNLNSTLDTLGGVRDRSLDLYRPAQEMGNNALSAYGYNLGLGGKKPAGYTGLEMTPGAQFLLNEGRTEIEGGAAGAGGLYSGATLEALEKKRAGIVATDRDNQMAQLYNLVNTGQNASGAMAGIEQNFGTGTTAARNYATTGQTGAWQDYTDSANANMQYWNGQRNSAIGNYTGTLAGMRDANYDRISGLRSNFFGDMSGITAGYTDRTINNLNNYTANVGAARQNRVTMGQNAGQSYVNNASNALAQYGNAAAQGAYGTASAINSGINNGFGIYGMLGGGFGQQQQPTQWPMSKPPMPRPA